MKAGNVTIKNLFKRRNRSDRQAYFYTGRGLCQACEGYRAVFKRNKEEEKEKEHET